MRRKHRRSLKDKLLSVKLEIERAKLSKMHGVLNADGCRLETYLHYDDLPAPSMEDRERIKIRLAEQSQSILKMLGAGQEAETHNVNPMTHNPHTGKPYDFSSVEAQFGPYDRADKPTITVPLRHRPVEDA